MPGDNTYATDRFSGCRLLLVAVVITSTALLVYANAYNAPFIYDDTNNICSNPHIRMTAINVDSIAAISKSPSPRPLANLTLALNYYFNRFDVRGYHMVNLFIHIITSLLIFLIARQTLQLCKMDDTPAPLLAALLWLVNPVHTQSVTYTIQRMNALAALFYLLALFCYIRARIRRNAGQRRALPLILYTLCLASGVFGLLSKQTAATLPIILFLYEWYFFQNLGSAWFKKKMLYIGLLIIVVMALSAPYLGTSPIDKILAGYEKHHFTPAQRLLTEPSVVLYYICLLFFPHPDRLMLIYDFPAFSSVFSPVTSLLGIMGVLVLALAGVLLSEKHRLLSFAIVWFLVNLLIESSIFGLALVFEHRTYLPSVFPFISLTALAMAPSRKRISAAAICLLIIICGVWTHQRNTTWSDLTRFWHDNIAKAPHVPEVSNNLGQTLLASGKTRQAADYFKIAVNRDPRFEASRVNLGVALQQLGFPARAMTQYRKVLDINPTNTAARFNLAMQLKEQGQTAAAIGHLEKIITADPDNTGVLLNLGVLRMEEQKNGQALTCLKQAAALNSTDTRVLNNLGIVLHRLGRTEEAISAFHQGLTLESHNPQLHNNLGLVLMDLGRYKQAAVHFQQALSADPYLAEACNNLGLVSERQGNNEQAADYFHRALMISPSYDLARYNLALLLVKTGQVVSADSLLAEITIVKPAHWPVLNQLVVALAEKQALLQSTTLAEKIAAAMPDNDQIHYNLACLYARQRNTEKALLNLEKAVDLGYHRWEYMKTDPDLENIRHTDYYKHLIKYNITEPKPGLRSKPRP